MSILGKAFAAPYSVPSNRSVVHQSPWWGDSKSVALGENITDEKAFSFLPFFAGVRLISQAIGRLPLITYRRLSDDDRERARNEDVYRLLHDEPNPEMSALLWKEAMQGHLTTRGNCYSEIVRDPRGRVRELWPLRPDRMQVLRDSATTRKFYRYQLPSGENADLTPDQVFHIPAFGYDGYVGYSSVTLAREALGLGLAAQDFGARFFRSGARPAAVVTHPKGWTDTERKNFTASLRSGHQGLSNAQRIAIIEEGVSWETVGMKLDDAQFLETRQYQRNEMATLLQLPPHMIGDLERATFSNIEEQGLNLVVWSLDIPWFGRWEAEVERQIIKSHGPDLYAEFLVDALLRGRFEDRMKAYQLLWSMGVMNADTIARKENLPAPADGSRYYVPANFLQVGEEVTPEDRASRIAATVPASAADIAHELARLGNGHAPKELVVP